MNLEANVKENFNIWGYGVKSLDLGVSVHRCLVGILLKRIFRGGGITFNVKEMKMELGKKDVVHIGTGKDTLSTVPSPPAYLSSEAKKHFKTMGQKLAPKERLKDIYIDALIIYAEAMAQFEWATKEINKKNKLAYGEGYIQTYKTGATNISTELVLRNNAADTLIKCFKQFGLDPKSEKDLNAAVDSGQFDLFEQFLKAK